MAVLETEAQARSADLTSLGAAELAAAIAHECGDLMRARAAEAGSALRPLLEGRGVEAVEPPFLRRHRQVLVDGPEITVVICTRDRPEDLDRTVTTSCLFSTYRSGRGIGLRCRDAQVATGLLAPSNAAFSCATSSNTIRTWM